LRKRSKQLAHQLHPHISLSFDRMSCIDDDNDSNSSNKDGNEDDEEDDKYARGFAV